MSWRAAACAGALAVTIAQAHAATADRTKVAEIYADRVNIDQQQETSRYLGNVEFNQGSVRITGDDVLLVTPGGELQRIDIRGAPATYREIDDSGMELRARAEKIFYDNDAAMIRLEGDAHLCRGGEYFSSVFIEYNTQTRAVNAGKRDATSEERVRITLRPQNATTATSCDAMP